MVQVAAANVSFQVLVLDDAIAERSVWHTPPVCDPLRDVVRAQSDCFDVQCNSTQCASVYILGLPSAAGTAVAYVLQVRAVLFGTPGPVSTLRWTHKRCAAHEFAVLSGYDTVDCVP